MTRWVLLAFVATVIGCEQTQPPAPNTAPTTTAQAPKIPTPEVVGLVELREPQTQVIEQVLTRHNISADDVKISLDDALNLDVTGPTGTQCSRKVPSAFVPAELVTNFDHTLDHCLRDVTATP